jgi:hypothetical protein
MRADFFMVTELVARAIKRVDERTPRAAALCILRGPPN